MKKKFLCVVLCLACCFGFAGCGNAKLEAQIAELQAQVDELQSHFTPSDKIYKLGETATIYSNGKPLVNVTYVGVSGASITQGFGACPVFKVENLTNCYLPLHLGMIGYRESTGSTPAYTYSPIAFLANETTTREFNGPDADRYDYAYIGPIVYVDYYVASLDKPFDLRNARVIPCVAYALHPEDGTDIPVI